VSRLIEEEEEEEEEEDMCDNNFNITIALLFFKKPGLQTGKAFTSLL
jgi:hypothetical protein